MNHISDDQLVLHYYGEAAEQEAADHLAHCPECHGRYRSLQMLLNTVESAPVPHRNADYGEAVWKRIEPKLPGRRRRWKWLTAREWSLAAVLALLLLGAFLVGRYTRPGVGTPAVAQAPLQQQPVRERVLLVAVGDYLERSQMVLVELANAPGSKALNIADEQRRAEDLLEENRLYRQTANASGDQAIATVLDELERTLLEVAHSPADLSGPQLQQLQKRLEDQGVLFKIRVLGSRVQQRETDLARKTKSTL